MALGALIGGLLLAGTEYRRQVEVTIEPFKGLLVGLFLISIGMSLDLRALIADPAIGARCRDRPGGVEVCADRHRRHAAFGLPWNSGAQIGLLLGPGGEFSFVIVSGGPGPGCCTAPDSSFVLIVAALTMIEHAALSKLGARLRSHAPARDRSTRRYWCRNAGTTPHVIVAGFGRVGQTVAAMLEAHRVAMSRSTAIPTAWRGSAKLAGRFTTAT